jgi:hypothetical protein
MKAEEFLNQHLTISHFYDDITDQMVVPSSQLEQAMVDFAKMHVEQALKEASKTNRIDLYVRPDVKGSKYKKIESGESYDLLGTRQMWKINKDSILNAYPLTNIK